MLSSLALVATREVLGTILAGEKIEPARRSGRASTARKRRRRHRLASMTRAEAFVVVRQHGGTPSQAVTKRTNLLTVGELGWPLLDDGRPSNKLIRARSYIVAVVSERRFLEWIGKFIPDNANKAYSVDQLASLSGLSGEKIQSSHN